MSVAQMRSSIIFLARAAGCLLLLAPLLRAEDAAWPPALRGAVNGTVTLCDEEFLRVPAAVAARRDDGKIVPFDVAKTAPTVELTFHDQLGPDAIKRRLWSSWGDICVASDGRVYCGLGDHGNDAGGDARCFVYRWDPAAKQLRQIVDMNRVVEPRAGQPAWSKVHAKIDEGPDGKIYFSCTLNGGQRAGDPKYGFNDSLPGGQLYQYDPSTDRTEVFANLPPRRCTATSILDRERNVWWCNLEAGGGDALWGIDLATKKVVFQGEDGSAGFNRAFALLRDGRIFFNGADAFRLLDPAAGKIETAHALPTGSPGMRCATCESRDGHVYGVLQTTHQLFRYTPARDELKLFGASWLEGEYTAVCVLSPDGRFLYYLPGSHGRAWTSGTPVIQYNIATGHRKVLAFLAPAFERAHDFVPAGTYGMKLSGDGATIYVNFNGHAADRIRSATMKPIGFGLPAFAAIHIPPSERSIDSEK
jgi:sugar lactone lactonase YvrE